MNTKKTEKLFEAFTELDDDLIENALPKDQDYDVVKPALKINSWKPWVAGAAVAAAAFGVVFAGFKLFGGGKPGFGPAVETSDSSDAVVDNVKYGEMIVDWVMYDSAEELVKASDIICTGKVNDISFTLIDPSTGMEIEDGDNPKNGELCTIYDIEVTKMHSRDRISKGRLWFRVMGGLKGYKTDEQLEVLKRIGSDTIMLMYEPPEIELGEEYLFLLADFDYASVSGGSIPTIINGAQGVYPLSDPTYRDEFSGASVKDIISCAENTAAVENYAELEITHNNSALDLSQIDRDKLIAVIQDEMTTNCMDEHAITRLIDKEIKDHSETGYVIDLVYNDIDAPLGGKMAMVICHTTVIIGADNEESLITISYTDLSVDGASDERFGGTYILSTICRNKLLGCIGECSISHNDCINQHNATHGHECLFDYFYSDNVPKQDAKDFTLPEFPGVEFRWTQYNVTAITDDKWELFSGMPVWGVYLADLNGDGKREICSTVSMGSGIVDNRILAYDYANGKLYELQDRPTSDYSLTIKDGTLMYVQSMHSVSSVVTMPLTLDAMTEVPSTAWNQPDTTSHHEEDTSHHEEDHNAVPITPANSETHHSEQDETHH